MFDRDKYLINKLNNLLKEHKFNKNEKVLIYQVLKKIKVKID